jgi:hypothetical protein
VTVTDATAKWYSLGGSRLAAKLLVLLRSG